MSLDPHLCMQKLAGDALLHIKKHKEDKQNHAPPQVSAGSLLPCSTSMQAWDRAYTEASHCLTISA